MWIYFKRRGSDCCKFQIGNESALTVRRIRPKVFGSLHNFVWSFFSFFSGSFTQYQLLREEKVVCVAETISWIPMFQFMPRNGIHIGPCRTIPEERGKGYYPYLLETIIEENPEKEYYMIIDKNNLSSIRGVEKVGFRQFSIGEKRFGLYIITGKNYNQ